MYTLQSGQIENALRMGGAPDASAKQMVQQLANCQQLLEHRGPVALTRPVVNNFPAIVPARNSASYPFTNKNVTINVPPWQSQEWKPLPFLPLPPWENVPYAPWPDGAWEAWPEKPLTVAGGANLGPTAISELNCGPVRTNGMTSAGDVHVGGNLTVTGSGRFWGDLFVGGNLTTQGTATFNGPVDMAGPVVVGGVSLLPFTVTVVSEVGWDSVSLSLWAKYRTLRLFGFAQRTQTKSVVQGTECP